jgi:hypothetical protein
MERYEMTNGAAAAAEAVAWPAEFALRNKCDKHLLAYAEFRCAWLLEVNRYSTAITRV